MDTAVWAGVDVAKAHLDLAVEGSTGTQRFSNDDTGVTRAVDWLRERQPAGVVVEATGGYERALLLAASDAGLPVAVVNARQVREFARATGQLAKTDALDAHVLARFGGRLEPRLTLLAEDDQADFSSLVARRRQLQEMLTAERNRLSLARPSARRSIEAHIGWLEQELAAVEQQLEAHIAADPAQAERAALLRSVPGVGPVLTQTLLADFAELGTLEGRQAAALAGSPRSTVTVAPSAAGVVCGADGHRCAQPSTWPPSSAPATTRSSAATTSACSPRARRRSSPSSPACASSW